MVQRSKGLRSKSRSILRKSARTRGLTPITAKLRDFPEGTRVAVVLDPASHGGMPHLRFQGHTGVVAGRRGEAFLVKVVIGKKEKTLIARPEHLKRVQ
jgi:large subunit ribosomal protein L21e